MQNPITTPPVATATSVATNAAGNTIKCDGAPRLTWPDGLEKGPPANFISTTVERAGLNFNKTQPITLVTVNPEGLRLEHDMLRALKKAGFQTVNCHIIDQDCAIMPGHREQQQPTWDAIAFHTDCKVSAFVSETEYLDQRSTVSQDGNTVLLLERTSYKGTVVEEHDEITAKSANAIAVSTDSQNSGFIMVYPIRTSDGAYGIGGQLCGSVSDNKNKDEELLGDIRDLLVQVLDKKQYLIRDGEVRELKKDEMIVVEHNETTVDVDPETSEVVQKDEMRVERDPQALETQYTKRAYNLITELLNDKYKDFNFKVYYALSGLKAEITLINNLAHRHTPALFAVLNEDHTYEINMLSPQSIPRLIKQGS